MFIFSSQHFDINFLCILLFKGQKVKNQNCLWIGILWVTNLHKITTLFVIVGEMNSCFINTCINFFSHIKKILFHAFFFSTIWVHTLIKCCHHQEFPPLVYRCTILHTWISHYIHRHMQACHPTLRSVVQVYYSHPQFTRASVQGQILQVILWTVH